MRDLLRRLVAAACALLVAPAALAQSGGDIPGRFDFWVLSLAWSPSFCEAEGGPNDRLQCDSGRGHTFVVHGLWPQYERGYPEFCDARPSRAPERNVRAMLDLMPSAGLIRHQWTKHGSCSGMTPDGYFALTRQARARIVVPPAFAGVAHRLAVAPHAVEEAFRRANPGLTPDGIAVACDRRLLTEVRICLTRDLAFRSCPEVDRRGCPRDSVVLPPVDG